MCNSFLKKEARFTYLCITLFLIATAALIAFGVTSHAIRGYSAERACEVYHEGRCAYSDLVE